MATHSQRKTALQRERARRHAAAPSSPDSASLNPAVEPAATPRDAARTCARCGTPLVVATRGRIPTWCTASCRQRAWEERRAAQTGQVAVKVVERIVERIVEVPAPHTVPRHEQWNLLLEELATQLTNGQIYNRDLPELQAALTTVSRALAQRRSTVHGPR